MTIFLVALFHLFALVYCTGSHEHSISTESLLDLTRSSRPSNPTGDPTFDAFDCGWRVLALQYAPIIQPWLTTVQLQELYDALEIKTFRCNMTEADSIIASHTPVVPQVTPSTTGGPTLYVDYTAGSDSGAGTVSSPLKTISAALALSRATPNPASIILRNGTHYLLETLTLTPIDSGISFSAYPGESPVVSGAFPLKGLQWVQMNTTDTSSSRVGGSGGTSRGGGTTTSSTSSTTTATAPGPVVFNTNNVHGQCGNAGVPNKGVMADWQACQASCLAASAPPTPCTSWTFNNGTTFGKFSNVCCWRTDGVWAPRTQASTISQNVANVPGPSPSPSPTHRPTPPPSPNGPITWGAKLPPLPPTLPGRGGGLSALHINGHRATLARFPNADSELDIFPVGYVGKVGVWLTPTPGPIWNTSYLIPLGEGVQDGGGAMYINYTMGEGGEASRYTPPQSFWASQHFQPSGRWEEMHLRSPSGLAYESALPHAPYHSLSQVIVHSWRDKHWFSWMFGVGGVSTANGSSAWVFDSGGHQGGEGCDLAAEWWVEGAVEELDAFNEFFYDPLGNTLFLIPNATDTVLGGGSGAAPSPPVDALEVPYLSTFFNLSGTPATPITNVTFSGLGFTAGRPTFMDPRGVPSGGDWGLERNGVILLEGSVGVSVSDCHFSRIDGNSIFLSGFNRGAVVQRNTFVHLGQSAVASWGKTPPGAQGFNASDLEVPLDTLIHGNLATNLGEIQKQSSMYFQAVTARATISANIVYNIPRAAVNFNDNFGGGSEMKNNLFFNTCRESSDHSSFNSWGRLPYVTNLSTGLPSAVPAFNEMHSNFLASNYGADGGCLDLDDGSSYYIIHSNFCPYGGSKSDFTGHSSKHYNNLQVFPQVYGPKCLGIFQNFPTPGFANEYFNNTCLLLEHGMLVVQVPTLNSITPSEFAQSILLGNNTVFIPGGDGPGPKPYTNYSQFIDAGFDVGTVLRGDMPTADVIIGWAKALLFPPTV